LSAALILRPGAAAKSLMSTEEEQDDLIGGAKALAQRLLRVYGLLTVAGIAALAIAGVPVFNAVLYTLAAVSTGGFAPDSASLAAFDGRLAPAIILAFSLAGALPLLLYRFVRHAGAVQQVNLAQAAAVILAWLLFGFALTALLSGHASPWYHGFMTAASAQSTAGFSTLPPAELPPGGKLLMIGSMMVGGSVGSTAGGMKMLRVLILYQCLRVMVARTGAARGAVMSPRLAGKKLDSSEINDALMMIILAGLLTALSWLPFVIAGFDPLDALFEVASAGATVGLSTGITGPDLAVGLKALLCVDMLLGRLEILAWLAILHPRAWFGRRG
jgi:trk system potassium uptake protein TrkH